VICDFVSIHPQKPDYGWSQQLTILKDGLSLIFQSLPTLTPMVPIIAEAMEGYRL
jgi:hypothetical protein